jgi:ribonuclease P protein component
VSSLPSRSDFDHIFQDPDAKASTRDFLILARNRHGPETTSRIGFVTPKKKLRRAVDRNRFRRVHREYLRAHVPEHPIDCIVIAKSRPDDLFDVAFQNQLHRTYQKLFRHLAELLQ